MDSSERLSLVVGGGMQGEGSAPLSPPEPEQDSDYDSGGERGGSAVDEVRDAFPLVTDCIADADEADHPDEASGVGVQRERPGAHLTRSRDESGEMTHAGDEVA